MRQREWQVCNIAEVRLICSLSAGLGVGTSCKGLLLGVGKTQLEIKRDCFLVISYNEYFMSLDLRLLHVLEMCSDLGVTNTNP